MDFEEELKTHIPFLNRYAHSLAPDKRDDLVQQTLFNAWANQHTYRFKQSMRAWLIKIMTYIYINDWRRAKRRQPFEQPNTHPEWEEFNPLLVSNDDQETALMVKQSLQAIETLPQKARDVLYLLAQDLKYEDVANILKVPVGTVKSRLNRARQRLKDLDIAPDF